MHATARTAREARKALERMLRNPLMKGFTPYGAFAVMVKEERQQWYADSRWTVWSWERTPQAAERTAARVRRMSGVITTAVVERTW